MRTYTDIPYSTALLRHWHNSYRHLYDWDSATDKLCCQLNCLWNGQSLLKNFNISTVEDCSKAQGSNLTPCLWGIRVLTVICSSFSVLMGRWYMVYYCCSGRGWILSIYWRKKIPGHNVSVWFRLVIFCFNSYQMLEEGLSLQLMVFGMHWALRRLQIAIEACQQNLLQKKFLRYKNYWKG